MSEPLVHRVRGLALALLGQLPSARVALSQSLVSARGHHSRHEIAWTLDAQDWLGGLDGQPLPDRDAEERQQLLTSLGISYIRRPATSPATVVLPTQRSAVDLERVTTDEGRPADSAATERRAR